MIKDKGFRVHTMAAAVSLAVSGLSTVYTVEASAQGNGLMLEEVVVTAQKREQNLQDVPLSIEAFSADTLRENGIANLAELSRISPSVTFTAASTARNTSIRIRGVGTDVYSSSVEPSVGVVVDGVPLARTSMTSFEFNDIERIEVLRGPQGTLFGKNASAGLISVITRDPSAEPETSLEASYAPGDGGENELRTRASVSGPLTDGLQGRVSGFYSQVDGQLYDVAQDTDTPEADSYGVRGKLLWDAIDDLTVRLSADYANSTSDGFPASQRLAPPTYDVPGITPGEENRDVQTLGNSFDDADSWGLNLSVEWGLGADSTLSSITGYRDYSSDTNTDAPATNGVEVIRNGGPRDIQTFSQELRIDGATNNIEYTVGGLYFYNSLDNQFVRQFMLSNGALQLDSGFDNTVDTTNLGLFGQATWHVTDRLALTGGLRYTYEKVEVAYSNFQTLSQAATGNQVSSSTFDPADADVDDQQVTGKLAAQFNLTDEASVYASFSTGYRGRAYNLVSDTTQSDLDNPLDAEDATAWEVGLKSEWFGRRVLVNATAFWVDFENFQAQALSVDEFGGVNLTLRNAGELRTRGVEADFTALATENLRISGAVSYTDAEFTDFANAPCYAGQPIGPGECVDDQFQDLSGNGVLPNAPKWRLSLQGRQEIPIPSWNLNSFVQVGWRWQSEVQFQVDQHPYTKQEAYGITDLSLGLGEPNQQWEVSLFVRNVFDQNYAASITANPLGSVTEDTVQLIPRSAQRSIGLALYANF